MLNDANLSKKLQKGHLNKRKEYIFHILNLLKLPYLLLYFDQRKSTWPISPDITIIIWEIFIKKRLNHIEKTEKEN